VRFFLSFFLDMFRKVYHNNLLYTSSINTLFYLIDVLLITLYIFL